MFGVLDVHLVGGEGALLHIALSFVGPLLIAGAAVFAAKVARDSASDRQVRQLAHDTERQEEVLAHDRAMRELELGHDREARRRERERDTLDSVLESLHQARVKTNAFSAAVIVAQDGWRKRSEEMGENPSLVRKTELQTEAVKTETKLQTASTAALESQMALNGDWTRLMLRFGAGHSITQVFKGAMDTMGEVRQAFRPGISGVLSGEEFTQAKKLSTEIGSRFGEFTATCREWDGS